MRMDCRRRFASLLPAGEGGRPQPVSRRAFWRTPYGRPGEGRRRGLCFTRRTLTPSPSPLGEGGCAEFSAMPRMSMVEAIRDAMDCKMAEDERVVVFGEDVGYFGGVFRCT